MPVRSVVKFNKFIYDGYLKPLYTCLATNYVSHKDNMWTVNFFLPLRNNSSGPRPPHYRGFMITLSWTPHTR